MNDLDQTAVSCELCCTQKSQATQVNEKELEPEKPVTIGDQLRSVWGIYRNSATIHGVSSTSGPDLYAQRRVIWRILVIVMAILLARTLLQQLDDFGKYPFKTKVMVKYVSQMNFPTLTICSMNQFHLDRIPDNHLVKAVIFYSSEFSHFEWAGGEHQRFPVIPNGTDISGQELLNLSKYAAHKLEDLFVICEWRTRRFPCEDLFVPKLTSMGLCYTFNGNISGDLNTASTGPFQGLRIIVNTEQHKYYYSSTMRAGIQFVVGRTNDTPFPEIEGWTVRPGVAASVAVETVERNALPYPYTAFGDETCMDSDSPSFQKRLKRYEYKQSACMYECNLDFLISVCNCTHFNDPGFRNETRPRLCSGMELTGCYLPAMKKRYKEMEGCECPRPCKEVTFTSTMSYADISSFFMDSLLSQYNISPGDNYVRSNLIDLKIYFSSMGITKINQYPELTLSEIGGNVGGQMGLFLGASLLSITEFLEMLILLFWTSLCLIAARLKRNGK